VTPIARLSIAFTLGLLAVAPPAAQSPDGAVTAFVNVNVVPMDRERVLRDHTVVVRGERIVALGPAASVTVPEGARRIEGRGHYLIPGLAEMHAHFPGGTAPDSAIERVLLMNVAHGITTVRNMLGDPRHLPLRERANKGELLSPYIYTSGPSLNGKSVPTSEAAVTAVEAQKAAGYDFLKIHPGITRGVFEDLAATANRVGIRFAGHVPLEVGLPRALELRYDTIDHIDGYIEALVRAEAPVDPGQSQFFGINLARHLDESKIPALVEATKKAGTWIVPTQVLFDNLIDEQDPDVMAKRPEMRWATEQQIAQWTAAKHKFREAPDFDAATRARYLETRRRILKSLHDGGVGMLLGADAPQMWNVPGYATLRELDSMVRAGLTPFEALSMGTRQVAVYYGTEATTGTIAEGRRADLVLLEANPLENVEHVRRQAGVMLRGTWLPRAELDKKLDAAPAP
jgi:imidazolonepropionase-like amidohydrolase